MRKRSEHLSLIDQSNQQRLNPSNRRQLSRDQLFKKGEEPIRDFGFHGNLLERACKEDNIIWIWVY